MKPWPLISILFNKEMKAISDGNQKVDFMNIKVSESSISLKS